MKNLIPIFVLLCMTSSCATIFAGKHTQVTVRAPSGTKIVCEKRGSMPDTLIAGRKNIATFSVLRSKEPLILSVSNDSLSGRITVKPILSWLFYANLFGASWVGILVDAFSPKRFTYRRSFIEARKTEAGSYLTSVPRLRYEAGSAELLLVPPLLNGWALTMGNMTPSASPIGLGLGFNYHYAHNRFISGDVGLAWAKTGVMGSRRAYSVNDNVTFGPTEQEWGWYATLRHHHRIGRFDAGYGLSWGQRHGRTYYTSYSNGYYVSQTDISHYLAFSIGAAASVNFRITNSLFAGVNYMPQVLEIDKSANLSYRHMMNFGLYWRLRVSTI